MTRRLLPLAAVLLAAPARATHDPLTTATVVVGGFEQDGFQATGVFGDVKVDDLLDDIASLVNLPTSNDAANLELPNVVTATEYYGDTAPAYYDAQDDAELAQVTALWGGGVPRYALIVAKFARHVMDISGATQVNMVSASFGSLVVRWMIEKDVEGLASQAKIARWMSAEGLLAGSWPASQPELIELWELAQVPSTDVNHMKYDWLAANLHDPRTDTDDPDYANILLGTFGSTDDHLNNRALTTAMVAAGEFQANDGVQGLDDTYFHNLGAGSKLEGKAPLRSIYHDDHYGLENSQGAWAQLALFLTKSRRVTITMTRAQVNDIHENIFLRPAEVVFESAVFSPFVGTWGILDPISQQEFEGAGLPIHSYTSNGQSKSLTQVIFDGMVAPEETALNVQLGATEIDLELRYEVTETFVEPFLTNLGAASLTVPIGGPGTYTIAAADWNCDLTVGIHEYAFDVPTSIAGVQTPSPSIARLRSVPNPARAFVQIMMDGPRETDPNAPATLRVLDAAGRVVRTIRGTAGQRFVWDARDARRLPVPGGVYFTDLRAAKLRAQGKCTLLR